MARPRRTTEQELFDIFADWDAADQASALRVMEALHRQKRRAEGKTTAEPAQGALIADEGEA